MRAAAFAATAVLTLAVAACGSDGGDDLPPPASPPADGSPPTGDPEHREILDVYYGSVEAMVAAQAAGDPNHPDLALYFLDRTSALMNIESSIQQNDARGMYYSGDLEIVAAEIAEIDMDAEPPLAVIDACVDYSSYHLVHREDDSPVSETEPAGRHPVISQAVLATDDHWYIATSEAHWDESC